ncbi:putative threonine synthase (ts) [hydrocarbon metagenome]|uniref:Putative threonine synthase (Ts) n=1 Tax=hydrocarbon metagenome TaxID=938273 RepID=A0A0W8FVZ6_9ZZZZ
MLEIKKLVKESDFDENLTREKFVDFLYNHLDQFGDSKEAINKCIDFAFSKDGKLGGFLLAAYFENNLVGTLIINNTGMSGYIPEHILVYVAVDASYRGKGFGKQIVERAISDCPGDVKLHVEYENPAKRLYERIGFTTKYAEMRFKK